ncbi:hypothetical protein [Desulfovibrio ferrophilus]|uniref:HTTM domain protein n=1 Tax=Desulfovibrio ferrophilus TaxID=241368 RepID=A0A2Z6AZS1_9BACT|nr:hypothetical protein [Desulfovibrio ferrophilus]BBD08749.1 HTTM domain protein [Desulfovibrio ferrophilus]
MQTLMNDGRVDGGQNAQTSQGQDAETRRGQRDAEAPLMLGLAPEQIQALGLKELPRPGQVLDVLGQAVVRNSPDPEALALEIRLTNLADPEAGQRERSEERETDERSGKQGGGQGAQEEFFRSLFQGGA